ncbi:hypothetical protein DY000_02059339 [Brassica cretica]|uniref:Uncharacterized protein n=1 Tax=Brassica cretica TaxID=69181 RepID=A0ABQ7ARR8_BRACR|nr:hypothetical protein DY000_02059339 [Brassica cretica]
MNLGRELRRGRELSTSYRVSSRDGRLQSGSRDEAETDACSRGREMRLRRGHELSLRASDTNGERLGLGLVRFVGW